MEGNGGAGWVRCEGREKGKIGGLRRDAEGMCQVGDTLRN